MSNAIQITRREAVLGALSTGLALATAPARNWRILLVVAHPDDEYYFAATTYRLAQELDATVDHVVLTNGEGGFKYSALAEKIYGCPLTDEATGRARLPEIRRNETLASGRILGIRHHHFLNQPDLRFTLDIDEALARLWDLDYVRHALRSILEREHYDFVFTLLPRSTTHGHHQAAALLAAEVIASLPESARPLLLAADTSAEDYHAPARPAFASTPQPAVEFDRQRSFGPDQALHYSMIVHWVIAEHKSQGMFQNDWGKDKFERFWLLGAPAQSVATERLARLRADLSRTRPETARLASNH